MKLIGRRAAEFDANNVNLLSDWLTTNICVDVCNQIVRISANLGEF